MKADPAPSPTVEVPEGVRSAAAAIVDRKGLDLQVLYVGDVCDFTDFFLIASGTSDRQVQAMADAVQERLRGEGSRPLHVEGEREAKWLLLDYGDFLVHLFDAEKRDFYRLERLWSDAPRIALRDTGDGDRTRASDDESR
jgi:ribosome-associated protein